jgi:hypothetical protein
MFQPVACSNLSHILDWTSSKSVPCSSLFHVLTRPMFQIVSCSRVSPLPLRHMSQSVPGPASAYHMFQQDTCPSLSLFRPVLVPDCAMWYFFTVFQEFSLAHVLTYRSAYCAACYKCTQGCSAGLHVCINLSFHIHPSSTSHLSYTLLCYCMFLTLYQLAVCSAGLRGIT